MALVDEVRIQAQAGNGGNGVVRWLSTRGRAHGGPAGGDGGRGGDVLLEGVRDLSALNFYRYEKGFHAENGKPGESELRHGAKGASIVLRVPVGTIARVPSMEAMYEILHEGEQALVFKGGDGGKGNARFKGSTNQNPFKQTNGKPGQGGDIEFTLKLIADVGLVGLPNAGKSTFLNALTRAKAKTGAYPFTTLEPNLGDFYGYLIADIPGLIEGASSGKGLGTRFLKHAERTGFIVHLVSAEHERPDVAYQQVRHELESFAQGLAAKPELLLLSKTDLVSEELCRERKARLEQCAGKPVLMLSALDAQLSNEVRDELLRRLRAGEGE